MEGRQILVVCAIVGLIGIAIITAVVFFGLYLFKRTFGQYLPDHPWWRELFHFFEKDWTRRNIPRYLADSYGEFLQRRNEFWTTYVQVLIAALVVITLAILLVTKTISAEAGLPILSGVSGFAIGKGVSAGRAASMPPEREPS